MNASTYMELKERIIKAGFADDIDWSESVKGPTTADDFFREYCFVVCNSGMKWAVARPIFERIMSAIADSKSASTVFRHEGKTKAIDNVHSRRVALFARFMSLESDEARLEWLERLPYIGGITKYHLAKNFGMNVAKPDRHLARVAQMFHTTPMELCKRLAAEVGDRIATVDLVIWRACALGIFKPLLLLILLCLCGCAHDRMIRGCPNLYCVDSYRNIIRCGQPTPEGFAFLARMGITNDVKLDTEGEGSDVAAKANGMRVVYCPISTWQQIFGPVTPQLNIAASNIVPNTVVHCRRGQNRTGSVVMRYRVEKCGWTKAQALAEALSYGWGSSFWALKSDWRRYDMQKTVTMSDGGKVK